MNRLRSFVTRLVRDDQGQDLIEYALLGGFISIVALVGMTLLGTTINSFFQNITNALTSAGGS